MRDSLHRTRGWLDGMTYAILADEWRAGTGRRGWPLMPQDLSAVAWPVRTERLSIRPCATRRPRGDAGGSGAARRRRVAHPGPRRPRGVRAAVPRPGPDGHDPGRRAGRRGRRRRDARDRGRLGARSRSPTGRRGVQAEIGWIIDPAHAGQGYATEAAAALLRICFEELGCAASSPSPSPRTTRSWQLMERLGMRREQYGVRDSLHRSRGWQDTLSYALLADEWRARQPERCGPRPTLTDHGKLALPTAS